MISSKAKTWFIRFLAFGHGLIFVMVSTPAWADIYRYVDREGTVHFSNVPTSSKYRIYIRQASLGGAFHASTRYDHYILEAARKYGVPSSLIKAIIKAESDFDPHAVSESGACGLMQIMPETARALGVARPFDPRENIFAGVRYLKKLLTQYQGRLPLALAAYNAGPNRVDPVMGMPRIKETENFVRKVMEYFNRHRSYP